MGEGKTSRQGREGRKDDKGGGETTNRNGEQPGNSNMNKQRKRRSEGRGRGFGDLDAVRSAATSPLAFDLVVSVASC